MPIFFSKAKSFSWWYASNYSIVFSLLPSLILWELWRHRNKAIFDSVISPPWILIANVKRDLVSLLSLAKVRFHPSIISPLFNHNSVRVGQLRQRTVWAMQWLKPPTGFIKLNTDGACRGNLGVSAGGGIVRDSNGRFIYAFASYYGNSTSFITEARALFQGVKWLHFHGYLGAIIEFDSKVLYDCLCSKAKPP